MERFEREVCHPGGPVRIVVKWARYPHTTEELPSRLSEDLGECVYAAFCRAAGIDPTARGPTSATAPAAAAAAEAAEGAEGPEGAEYVGGAFIVEKFVSVAAGKQIEVKWLGYPATANTNEAASMLYEDLGANQFKAFCNAAGITVDDIDPKLFEARDSGATAATIMLEWYTDFIWVKRKKLAWCHRRGALHCGTDTTGGAENNFQVLKRPGVVNDKAPARALSGSLYFQEKRRLINLEAARKLEFSMVPPATHGVPGELLSCWTRAILKRIGVEAALAGLAGAATYHIWPVQPQAGSQATAAWALQRAPGPGSDTQHRVRVVHAVDGLMMCTCWVWEKWGVECRHCLAIHGSVADSSAAACWRRGSAQGVNDDILLGLRGHASGPRARAPALHVAVGCPANPPAWGVEFHERHVEFVGAGEEAARHAACVWGPPTSAAAATNAPGPAGGGAASTNNNYKLGCAARLELEALQAWISSPTTAPADALKLRQQVAALYAAGKQIISAGATGHAPGGHNGVKVHSDMRARSMGPGNSSRALGAHERGRR